MDAPILITMDNNPNEDSKRFFKTLESNKWDYRHIGGGTEWVNFLERARLYLDELTKISKENPTKIVVISDCRDVLCVREPKQFISVFKTFKKYVVASSEIFCGGSPIYTGRKDVNCVGSEKYWKSLGVENPPARQYINAGLVSGYAEALRSMFQWMVNLGDKTGCLDDQVLMGMYLNENPQNVALDYEAKLLHTTTFGVGCSYIAESQISDSPTFAEILGRGAFFIHIPGSRMGMGNSVVYDAVVTLIEAGFNQRALMASYEVSDEIPYGIFKYASAPKNHTIKEDK